jgi:hypothetical protein
VRLVGIHRRFIARCYRGGCPAVALCTAESYTTAAGFILQTVKRPQARYKLEVVRTTSIPIPYATGVQLYGATQNGNCL